MHDWSEEPEVANIEKLFVTAHRQGRNMTGVVRLHWDKLAPLLNTGYLSVAALARTTQISRNTLQSAVRQVRKELEETARPGPPASQRQPRSRTNPSATTARGPRPRRPEASASSPPTKVPDAEGWIPLENGSHYRRKPDNPNLFEVWKPGKQKPDMTSKHPDPNNQR